MILFKLIGHWRVSNWASWAARWSKVTSTPVNFMRHATSSPKPPRKCVPNSSITGTLPIWAMESIPTRTQNIFGRILTLFIKPHRMRKSIREIAPTAKYRVVNQGSASGSRKSLRDGIGLNKLNPENLKMPIPSVNHQSLVDFRAFWIFRFTRTLTLRPSTFFLFATYY